MRDDATWPPRRRHVSAIRRAAHRVRITRLQPQVLGRAHRPVQQYHRLESVRRSHWCRQVRRRWIEVQIHNLSRFCQGLQLCCGKRRRSTGFTKWIRLVFCRCLQADSWRVVSASDDRTLKVFNVLTLQTRSDPETLLCFNKLGSMHFQLFAV